MHSCPRESLSFSPPALHSSALKSQSMQPNPTTTTRSSHPGSGRSVRWMYRTSDLLNYTFGHAPRGLEDVAVAAHLLPIAIAKVAIPGPISALEALSTLHPPPHPPHPTPRQIFFEKTACSAQAQTELKHFFHLFAVLFKLLVSSISELTWSLLSHELSPH